MKANNGFGIDIAAIDNYTTLHWTIQEANNIAYNLFDGTCNAAVFVAGICLLLKQTYDPLTISQIQTALKNTGDIEGESPENQGDDDTGSYTSLDPYDENYYFGHYPGNYRIAYGIIDAYEMYLYVIDEFIP